MLKEYRPGECNALLRNGTVDSLYKNAGKLSHLEMDYCAGCVA